MLPAFKITRWVACRIRFMTVAHRFLTRAAFCIFLITVHNAFAQEKLTVNQTVSQTVRTGGTNKYPIRLTDGDYVEVSLTSRSGIVNLLVANPDGSLMREFAGPWVGAKNTYAFTAEGGGVFSLNIMNPSEQAATYELTLQKIVLLDERFRSEEWIDPDPSPRRCTRR